MTLLGRQLAKLGLDANAAPDDAGWRAFLDRVRRTYTEADQDRYTLERSLMISSREMNELHASLRAAAADLEERVADRTRELTPKKKEDAA